METLYILGYFDFTHILEDVELECGETTVGFYVTPPLISIFIEDAINILHSFKISLNLDIH